MRPILTTILIFVTLTGFACSCWGPSDFCSTVTDSITADDYVIMGKKLYDVEHGMEVEVLKSYRGDIEDESIIIWGDLGWLCRKYTSGFAVGDTFVFNLFRIKNATLPYERDDDFELSFCGRHYLPVKNGKVIGFISHSDAVQSVDIKTFDHFFERNDCSSIKTDIAEIEVIVSPNPFMDKILVRSNQRLNELELYDMTGRLILREEADRFYYRLDLSDFKFTSGMYILRAVGFNSEDKLIKIIRI